MPAEEESYFDEADDDEPGPSGADKPSDDVASGFPLVDYDDEDLQSPKGKLQTLMKCSTREFVQ